MTGRPDDAAAEEFLEILGSSRSMRWYREDPVDRALIERVLWAGTRASSPNNTQPWDFVVLTDADIKARFGAAVASKMTTSAGELPVSLPTDPVQRRTFVGAQNLVATFPTVPAIILICATNRYPDGDPITEWSYSAIYAAAQNMLVAARALGLGAAFTTFHHQAEDEIRQILGIPPDRIIGVTMPLGWPARPFGPVNRRPVSEVVHYQAW